MFLTSALRSDGGRVALTRINTVVTFKIGRVPASGNSRFAQLVLTMALARSRRFSRSLPPTPKSRPICPDLGESSIDLAAESLGETLILATASEHAATPATLMDTVLRHIPNTLNPTGG